jgi:S1-C subfamily serine protease
VLIGPLGWVLLALLVVLIGTIASTRTTDPNASAAFSVSETQPSGSTPIDLSSPTTKKPIEAGPSYSNGPAASKNLPTINRSSIPQLVAAAKPAIVKIEAYDAAGYPIKAGTGFFISADGIVVTNHHVIDGAKQIRMGKSSE